MNLLCVLYLLLSEEGSDDCVEYSLVSDVFIVADVGGRIEGETDASRLCAKRTRQTTQNANRVQSLKEKRNDFHFSK